MEPVVTGREEELKILRRLLDSKGPELLAIYGRRRVGKTYLIKTFFKDHLLFSCSGQYSAKTQVQLINFAEQLNKFFPQKKLLIPPQSWQEAFSTLAAFLPLSTNSPKTKKVLFFDELPWLDNHKSGFLSSFSYFWNMVASRRNDIIVVICGSAASWIISKVINDKGGLHNRTTERMRLLPFTLKETKAYLQYRNIKTDDYQLLLLYMAMGGVPAYLNAIQKGKSAAQNIEDICFSKDGMLRNEFDNLYSALFNSPDKHIQVITALAKKNKGLTRNEILTTGKLLTGGGLSTVLNELTESGFVEKIYPFGKLEKDSLYRLSDEFSLFYFKFMQHQKGNEKGQWLTAQSSHSYTSWCGYAFENICLKHIEQIKQAMQIGGVHSTASSWVASGNTEKSGAQIDLVIDRADRTITICEMKFSTSEYKIEKRYAEELTNKMETFRSQTGTRHHLLLAFITTYGIMPNTYSEQLADVEIKMEHLFK